MTEILGEKNSVVFIKTEKIMRALVFELTKTNYVKKLINIKVNYLKFFFEK